MNENRRQYIFYSAASENWKWILLSYFSSKGKSTSDQFRVFICHLSCHFSWLLWKGNFWDFFLFEYCHSLIDSVWKERALFSGFYFSALWAKPCFISPLICNLEFTSGLLTTLNKDHSLTDFKKSWECLEDRRLLCCFFIQNVKARIWELVTGRHLCQSREKRVWLTNISG